MSYRWYMTASAMREFMALAGISDDDGGPNWGRAERDLGAICAAARQTETTTHSGAQVWRTGRVRVGQRTTRLELTVMPVPRAEGDLPQLLRVRDKGAGGSGHQARHQSRGGRP